MLRTDFAGLADADSADILIIGAGISGLYCAWRLARARPEATIAVIERLDRTGGRLDTDIVEVKPGERVREEEGGMRFNYGMAELMNLNKALGLCDQIVDFPMSSADDTNRYNIRGRAFTVAEAKAGGHRIWGEIYNLKPEERGLSPTSLVTTAYRNVLRANDAAYAPGEPPEFWTKFREEFTWKGIPLNRWQMWGLLRDMGYSEECVQMLSETIGFAGPFKSLANAGDAFQILADFPKDPTYFTFENGFSTLPNAVAGDLEANHADRVRIYLSTNVDRVERDGESYVLSLSEAPCGHLPGTHIPAGEPKRIAGKALIVSAAAKGAEDLFHVSPAFRDAPGAAALWRNIHSALGMRLMKINLYFNKPWWEQGLTQRPPVQFGPNFTDMPVNAVYPFYSLPEKRRIQGVSDTPPPIRDAAAALTVYCDFENTHFWQGLQNVGPKFTSPLQEREDARRPQVLYPASQAVVEEARRQLATLFGTNWVPEPVLTSYRLWDGEEDFEFAYHQWRMNVADSEVRAWLAAPEGFGGLHFCNEAFSDMQGWVNGSLRSCDAVLAHFGLDPLPDDPCPNPADAPRDDGEDGEDGTRLFSGPWGV